MLHRTLKLYRDSFSGLSRDIWLLALVTFINRSGTMVLPFMTVYLTTSLDFTLKEAGWVMACFGAGSVLGNFLGGKLTDKFGYYWVQFWALFLSGAMFLILAEMETILQYCITVFVLSTIADAFRPANHASIAVYSKPENRTRSLSLIRLAINLGFSIGPAVGGLLAVWYGFKWLFWADGITCMSAAIFLRFALQQKEERVENQSNTSEGSAPILVKQSPYRDRTFLIFSLLTMLGSMVFMQLFSTIPVFFKQELGMNEGMIGAMMAINGLIIAIIEMPLIYIIEARMRSKLRVIAWGTFMIGLSFFALEISSFWAGIAVVFIVIITFGEILWMPFASVFALERSTPTTRGEYMGLYSSTWALGHIIGPAAGMFIADLWGFNTLWLVITGLSLATFFGYRLLESQPERRVLPQVMPKI